MLFVWHDIAASSLLPPLADHVYHRLCDAALFGVASVTAQLPYLAPHVFSFLMSRLTSPSTSFSEEVRSDPGEFTLHRHGMDGRDGTLLALCSLLPRCKYLTALVSPHVRALLDPSLSESVRGAALRCWGKVVCSEETSFGSKWEACMRELGVTAHSHLRAPIGDVLSQVTSPPITWS